VRTGDKYLSGKRSSGHDRDRPATLARRVETGPDGRLEAAASDPGSATIGATRGVVLVAANVPEVDELEADVGCDIVGAFERLDGRSWTVTHLVVGVKPGEVDGNGWIQVVSPLGERANFPGIVVLLGDRQVRQLHVDVSIQEQLRPVQGRFEPAARDTDVGSLPESVDVHVRRINMRSHFVDERLGEIPVRDDGRIEVRLLGCSCGVTDVLRVDRRLVVRPGNPLIALLEGGPGGILGRDRPEREILGRRNGEMIVLAEVTGKVTRGSAETADPGAWLEVGERFLLDGIGRPRRTVWGRVDLPVRAKSKLAVRVLTDLTDTTLTGLKSAAMRTGRAPDGLGFPSTASASDARTPSPGSSAADSGDSFMILSMGVPDISPSQHGRSVSTLRRSIVDSGWADRSESGHPGDRLLGFRRGFALVVIERS
jgi:hypothetical protein